MSTTPATRQMVTEHAIRITQTLSPAMKQAMLKVDHNMLRARHVKAGTIVALMRRELMGHQKLATFEDGRYVEVDSDYDGGRTLAGHLLTELGEAVLQVLVRGPEEALKRAIAADEQGAAQRIRPLVTGEREAHDYEPGDTTHPMAGDPDCRICGETRRTCEGSRNSDDDPEGERFVLPATKRPCSALLPGHVHCQHGHVEDCPTPGDCVYYGKDGRLLDTPDEWAARNDEVVAESLTEAQTQVMMHAQTYSDLTYVPAALLGIGKGTFDALVRRGFLHRQSFHNGMRIHLCTPLGARVAVRLRAEVTTPAPADADLAEGYRRQAQQDEAEGAGTPPASVSFEDYVSARAHAWVTGSIGATYNGTEYSKVKDDHRIRECPEVGECPRCRATFERLYGVSSSPTPPAIDVDAELPVEYSENLHDVLIMTSHRHYRIVDGDVYQGSTPGKLASETDMIHLEIADKAGLVKERITLVPNVSYFQLTDLGMRVLLTFDAKCGREGMPYTAELPPRDVLLAQPTRQAVAEYSEYYIPGPGRLLAEQILCDHGYRLTDSCPLCP